MSVPFLDKELQATTVYDAVKVLRKRMKYLDEAQSSWRIGWQEVQKYLLTDNGKNLTTGIANACDTKDYAGERRDDFVLNNKGYECLLVFAKGLYVGLTSPASDWFKLTIPELTGVANDVKLTSQIKRYVEKVENGLYDAFSRSNLYKTLLSTYKEIGGFGTGVFGAFFDSEEKNIYTEALTAGEYAISVDKNGRVNTLYRLLWLSVANLIDKFGAENCSPRVIHKYEHGQMDELVAVIHAVEPNDDRLLLKAAKSKKFRSLYFERDGYEERDNNILSVKGFDNFPYFVGRLNIVAQNIYGYGLGRAAMADIKMLQEEERRFAQAQEDVVNPPMMGPGNMIARGIDTSPGSFNPVDSYAGQTGNALRPLFQVNPDMANARASIESLEQRISRTFMNHIFAPFTDAVKTHVSATEIAMRQQQNLQLSGPEAFSLVYDMVEPFVNYAMELLTDEGVLPQPNEDLLSGLDDSISVVPDFVSPLMVAQKSAMNSGIEKMLVFLANIAQLNPNEAQSLTGMIDSKATVKLVGGNLGVPMEVFKTDAVIQEEQQKAERMSQEQSQVANLVQVSQAAKNAQQAGLLAGGGA